DTSVVIAVGGSRTFQVQTLVDAGFLENIVDPSADGQLCSNRTESKVKVTRLADTTGGLPNYRYDVTLYCKNSGYRYYTFPNDGLMEPAYLAADKYMKAQKLAAPQTIALSTLISKGYLKNGDMKTASGSCNNANSKVVASSSGNTVLYTVQLKCGSDVLNAKFSV
ncbi:MAG: hypothetical protein IJ193_03650, partial [Bacilli bacterium]|nr:hypothetical protein [Bacilli bacterium]